MSTPPAGLTALQGKHASLAQVVYMQNPAAPGCFDHSGLDLEVVQQEIGWIGAVGGDTAPLGRRQYHHRGLLLAKPALLLLGIAQNQLGARGGEDGPLWGSELLSPRTT